ncbi:MAG: hypothetical protein KJ061_00315 [Vicinamibacteraceae bacterium]|nr:hypothetical protein [Vicinamibacteraceae bacterium]
MRISFDALPDSARLWIFGAGSPVTGDTERRLLETVDAFLETWTAHRRALSAARDWRDQRFLLVGVDEQAAGVSGCSVDALVRGVRELEAASGVSLLDSFLVFYRGADAAVASVTRDEFRRLARAGVVSPETRVFDTTVERVGDVRAGRFEAPASATWHARAFFRDAARPG